MTMRMSMGEAKSRLAELGRLAWKGEAVVISRRVRSG